MHPTVSSIATLRFQSETPWHPTSRWHTIEAYMAAAAAAGFDTIGVDTVGAAPEPAEMVAILRAHGLACSDVAVLTIGPSGLQDSRSLDLAVRLNAPVCVTVAAPATDARDVVAGFRSAARRAQRDGVRLGVEPRPFGFPASLSEARKLCHELGVARAGVVLDTWMLHHDDGADAELADMQAEEVALVQLSDVAPSAGGDVRELARRHRCLPGQGVAAVSRTLRTLDEMGWAGPVSMEVLNPDFGSSDLADQMAWTRAAFDRCFQTLSRPPRVQQELT